jgi:hypothetical protein
MASRTNGEDANTKLKIDGTILGNGEIYTLMGGFIHQWLYSP